MLLSLRLTISAFVKENATTCHIDLKEEKRKETINVAS